VAKKQIILCDSNIIIDAINDVKVVKNELNNIRSENVLISVITEIEVINGAINKEMQKSFIKKLKKYNIIHIDTKTSFKASSLIKKYKLSHGLDIPDAFIAATALIHNLHLYTNNLKDFKFIEGLILYNPK